jgi:hypothetical protein
METRKPTATLLAIFILSQFPVGCDFEEGLAPAVAFTFTGEVLDARTSAPLPNVSVQFGTAITVTTDASGTYTVGNLPEGHYDVVFSKRGYITVTTPVNVGELSAATEAIYLVPSAPAATVGPEGKMLETPDTEGDVIRVSIPAGAVQRDISVTVTPLQGVEIPGAPPEGYLSIAAAHIGLESGGRIALEKPVTVTVPLPTSVSAGTEVPLFLFDETTRLWRDTGITATANVDGDTASAAVNQFGTFSVMPQVRIEEAHHSSRVVFRERLPDDQVTLVRTFQNSIEVLEDAGIDRSTLTYMIEQSKDVPFSRPTRVRFGFVSAEERSLLNEARAITSLLYIEERVRTTVSMTIQLETTTSVVAAPSSSHQMPTQSNASQNQGMVVSEASAASSDTKHDQGQTDDE